MTAILDFFQRKSPSLIGVDIASTSLKLVELSETGFDGLQLAGLMGHSPDRIRG